MGASRADKELYFVKLKELLAKYPSIFLVNVDNVGSNQMHQIRVALRGKGVVLMGKNTMVRRALRTILSEQPQFERLLPHIRGNIGFVFTDKELKEVRDLIVANKVKAPARAGALAPLDVIVPASNTGMEPGKTSFFQALGIPTKIARGTIEIVSDVKVVTAGTRVGTSEATLLNMLNISPFTYGMTVIQIFDAGNTFSPEVLDVEESELIDRFLSGIKTIAAISLALNYPTIVSVTHSLVNAYKNLIAIALATEYTFDGAEKIKEYLANPDAFAVAAPAAEAAPAAAAATPAAAEDDNKEEESDEDMVSATLLSVGGTDGGHFAGLRVESASVLQSLSYKLDRSGIASSVDVFSTVMASPSTPKDGHLIVVSNRLPITINKDANGEYHFKMSSGGLVSALSGFKKSLNFTWIGWPGFFIPPKDRPLVDKRLMEEYSCQAVYLDDDVADRHYNGFSNSILWPLFHYHPGEMNFDEENWLAYRQANLRFAEAVLQQLTPGAMVWVQDYHLMLLPMLLRALVDGTSAGNFTVAELSKITEGIEPEPTAAVAHTAPIPGIKIGFFLHTPFPSSEIYRILPVRREILLGVLSCDLIGFHTYDYARHFLSSCTRILGLPTMPNGVEFEGRLVHVGTFPIGIEPASFINNLQRESVQNRIAALEQRFGGVKVIVGVDRLDYIKGVPQKLHALELFLTQHPEWIGKVVLVQLAVPSRQDVEEYQNLRSTVNELVGRINGRFGTVEFMPIHFMHKSLAFDELCALYAVSDVCLVSSTRDGMNLVRSISPLPHYPQQLNRFAQVSYEYVACQQARQGVMILSEFAGAAQSLNGSLVVNPWDSQQVADAIHEAVTMDAATRAENHRKLFKYVNKYSAAFWGSSFIKEMSRIDALGEAEVQKDAQVPAHPNGELPTPAA
ncbi:hypothetical protein H0H81_007693 [Sphagnurus paluster]|uniref:Large ribosomal subunit protein uL10 n=1 Tax=Sphagnurus paluster TaxID=117069 RepID=A0A9P7GNF1_9AGAR|nr:hypothetical protein H0H81_007693 [Sphagnurus paluster]